MPSDDFVARLRRYDQVGPKTIITEAADEIERLRERLRLTNIEWFNMTAEVDRLRAERDEARRMVCSAYALRGRDIATERGWDCWKEER
jgi:hypothetical protein